MRTWASVSLTKRITSVSNLNSFPFFSIPRLFSRCRFAAPSTILSCTRYSTTPATKT
jgi:hypothetical protein